MKNLRILLFLLFLSVILISINVNSAFVIKDSNKLINAFKNDSLVRLHVVANSNSAKDQYIKRMVRNQVIEYMEQFIRKVDHNLKDELVLLGDYLDAYLKEENINYKAEAELGTYYFPSRTYEDLTLPAGRYKALKIVLGKGEGSNWWCVLLPPMCIENEEKETITDKKIEFRFKILEWLNKKRSKASQQ